MNITVFSKRDTYCGQCKMTERKLDELGFDYEVKAIEDQPADWLEEHKAAGRMQAPIVEVSYPSGGSIEWGGYRPDLIGKLEVR